MNKSSRISALTLIAGSLATTFVLTPHAFADDENWPSVADQRGTHVLDRERPEYDAVGIRAGSFMIYPELALGVTSDDNVFGTQNNSEGDIYYGVSPSVSIESDFGRHELNVNGYTDSRFYSSDSSEDRFDWGVGVDGIIEVSQFTQIQANAGYDELTEDRTSTNRVAGGIEPTEYDTFNAGISLNQRFNRLTASVGARYTENDYKDDAAIGGGVIDQDFRDHDKLEIPARLSYDVSPDTSIFVAGSYNTRSYDQQPPAVAVNRDSDGYDVGVGAAFDFTNLIRGEAFVGYLSQEYDQAGFAKVDGIDFGLSGEWYASELTTVSAGINRTVEESSTAASSGHLDTTFNVGIAHELQRNIILSADASFLDVDFEGITREDETISAGVAVQYLVNRNAELELGYDYTSRDSNAVGQDYDKNVVGLSLILKM